MHKFLYLMFNLPRFINPIFKMHTEESMVDQNSVNAQPISERAVYFSFLEPIAASSLIFWLQPF